MRPLFHFAIEREEGSWLLSIKIGPYIGWAVWGPPDSSLLRGCGFMLGPLSIKVTERDD
jgi:hypothetical protein